MSEENVRLAREMNDAVRRGDWDAVATSIDPHVSLRADPNWPEQRIYGREALLDFYRGLQEVQGTDVCIEEIVDLGDRLLVRLCWRTHGQHSGIEGELRLSEIVTIPEGRYVLIEYFLDHAEALKAVGLGVRGVSENAAVVRRGFDVWNAFIRGELSSEAYADGWHPQAEVIWQEQTLPDFPRHLRGRAELIALFEHIRDGWVGFVQEPLELLEAPDDRVLALVRQTGRGRQSDVPIVVHFFELFTMRDGKLNRVEIFRHRDDALQAAGLSG